MASNTPRIDGLERNLVINGNMDFWQRGTSVACNNNDDKYLADRFVIDVWAASVSATGTYSRSADVPTQAQSGFNSRYSLLYTNTSANSNSITVRYEVEGQDYQQIHAKKIRVQFWVKSSVAGTYSLGLQNGANQNRSYLTTYTIASANTWQKVAIDVQLDQTGTWNFNETAGLSILWGVGVPSNYALSALNTWVSSRVTGYTGNTASWSTTSGATFQIAQVSLIPQDFTLAGASNVDIPFQRAGRTIGHELAMCQRYYTKSFPLLTAPQNGSGSGIWTGLFAGTYISSCTRAGPTNGFDGFNQIVGREVTFPVSMRTAPTLVAYGTNASNWFAYDTNGVVFGAATMSGACDRSFTPTLGALIGTTTAQAQMGGHYTADAEL